MTAQVAPVVGPEAQKSILTIQKAKVKKQLLYAECTEQRTLENKPVSLVVKCAEKVHPDFERYFAQLVPHYCLLTEQLAETPDYWPEDTTSSTLPEHFAGYEVTGIIFSGTKNGVTLMGHRTLKGGKVLNMNSPFVSFEEAEDQAEDAAPGYEYAGQLETAVLDAVAEIEAALRGKCSDEGRQLSMFERKELGQQVVDDLIDSK